MAGRGPAPKAQRRHRAEPARGEWVDLPPLEKSVLPALPRRDAKSGPWSPRTKRAWDAWRADSVTGEYGPAEIQAAIDLAFVYEEWVRSGSIRFMAEIRQQQDRLGLNPKGKRDLRWRVGKPAEVVDLPAPKRERRLRAVEG